MHLWDNYTTTELKHTKRSSVRKQWTEEKTLAALQSVENQFLSGNKATDLHAVPRSTLKDRLTGWVVHSTRPEPKPYLSMTEEADLFCSVFQTAWLNAVTPAVIFGGFKKAGVFPFDRNAVHPHDKVVTMVSAVFLSHMHTHAHPRPCVCTHTHTPTPPRGTHSHTCTHEHAHTTHTCSRS